MFQKEDNSYLLLENGGNLLEESPHAYSFAATASSFSLSGLASSVSKQWKNVVESGGFIVGWFPSAFLRSYVIMASSGSAVVTGISAVFSRGIKIAMEAGLLAVSVVEISLRNFKASIDSIEISLSGYGLSLIDKLGVWTKERMVETAWGGVDAISTIWGDISSPGMKLLTEDGNFLLLENGYRVQSEQVLVYDERQKPSTSFIGIPGVTTIWT